VTAETELSVARMCTLAGFNRAGYYRSLNPAPDSGDDPGLRDAIQRIALQWPAYGTRRVKAELDRQGWKANRKRVQRLMREDNLLCAAKRKFVVTTDSTHPFPAYPNLAPGMEITGINQLWIADITYIRLEEEFVYLAVVLDAYSRRVIGWYLDDTMAETLTLWALRMALAEREVRAGLVHHSDRGVQYASGAYTRLLTDCGIAISMSRKGNPWDNAACESFMKTLKHEEVHRTEYRNLADARTRIGEFLKSIYNDRRLHSSLGYRSPSEFERRLEYDGEERTAA
jgi:putative transposase